MYTKAELTCHSKHFEWEVSTLSRGIVCVEERGCRVGAFKGLNNAIKPTLKLKPYFQSCLGLVNIGIKNAICSILSYSII